MRGLKLICVSQFLKMPENSSYNVDEATFLAEFMLPKQQGHDIGDISDDRPTEDLMLSAEQATVVFSRQLSQSELHTLNYMAGFCVKDFVGHCIACDNFLCSQPTDANATGIDTHTFTACMEFKSDKRSLSYASSPLVQLLRNAENYFKAVKSKLYTESNEKKQLVTCILNIDSCTVNLFPACHSVASNVLSKYFTSRLHALSLQLSKKPVSDRALSS
jgi:hypothetical protein